MKSSFVYPYFLASPSGIARLETVQDSKAWRTYDDREFWIQWMAGYHVYSFFYLLPWLRVLFQL